MEISVKRHVFVTRANKSGNKTRRFHTTNIENQQDMTLSHLPSSKPI
jgi:hypothetical protein